MGRANSFRVRPEPASLEGFTLIGVTLSVLQRLRGLARERQGEAGPPSAIRSGGSRQAGEALTTADVCYEIVRPATEGRRCPYCELADAGEMGTAQAFVSHAWLYPFELLVSALEEAAMPPETFFWVDIAVVNQHTNATRGFEWWSSTFRLAVKTIGRTLLVLVLPTLRTSASTAPPVLMRMRTRAPRSWLPSAISPLRRELTLCRGR